MFRTPRSTYAVPGRRHAVRLSRALAIVCALAAAQAGSGLAGGSGSTLYAQQPNFMTGFSQPEGPPSSLKPEQLKNVSFRQRLNEKLPLDTMFKDEYGRDVALGKYFRGERPVILAFVYFKCPMLCSQVMNGISASLRALSFTAGQEFDVVLVSFDPTDTPSAALEKERQHLDYWRSQNYSGGWHLLTGDRDAIATVTEAAGFTYQWDSVTGQYAHASGILVTTPDGTLARYFYGVEYSPKELRMALVESGKGTIGSAIDELLLYCYHYDPTSGRYGASVKNLLRVGGVATLAAMATFFVMMRRRELQSPLEGRV